MDRQADTTAFSPSGRVAAAAEGLAGTLRLARVLAQSRRAIDLAGLEQEIGRLCAAALDLPAAEGQAMRPALASLLAELEALSAGLPPPAEDGA